jgi:hypothetical protein
VWYTIYFGFRKLVGILKMAVFWLFAPCGLIKFTDVLEVLVASITWAMIAQTSTSETSVNFYQTTRRNNPEDSHLRTRCRENLKSHV